MAVRCCWRSLFWLSPPEKTFFRGATAKKKASQRSLFWLAFLLAVAPRKNVFAWDPPKLLD